WRTFASVRLAAEFKGTRFVTIPDTSLSDVCPGCAGHDLVGGSVTLALTHVVSAPVAVSRQDGFSWLALYRRRAEREGARWSSEARSRLGLYAHVPGVGGFAHHVLAVRLAAGASGGPLGGRRARRRPDIELRLLGAAPARRRRTARRSPLRRGAAPAAVCGVCIGFLSVERFPVAGFSLRTALGVAS